MGAWGYRAPHLEPGQMPLTDTAIRKAKPAEKPVKLSDVRGLYLLVSRTGAELSSRLRPAMSAAAKRK